MTLSREHKDLILRTIAGLQVLGYKLYGPRVTVLHDPALTMTKGGLHIPDTAQRRLPSGTIVQVGTAVDTDEGGVHVNYACEVGDRVLLNKYGGSWFFVTLPDGTDVELEVLSVLDLYYGWKEDLTQ